MKRLRWFSLSPISRSALKRVLEGMRREEFVEQSTMGFLVERTRADFLEARFIERSERTETVLSPFGGLQEFRRIDYQQTSFRLSVAFPQLEFADCPRSVSPAINCLSDILGVNCVVTPVETNVVRWLEELSRDLVDVRVSAAQISQFSLSETVTAKVLLRGTEDVRRFAKEITGRRPFRFDKLDVWGEYRGSSMRFEIRNDAKAVLHTDDADFIELLRTALAKSQQ